ncbi:HupE/UreJ family protein [Pseudohalocynthiibacter aestuariivivens]|uniref:HupE/UreJ family protein n=1 Tax=Pseudohalocynthiibacter aestuariivivens TaxID=1591409 RepID=A0ABV5JBP3_9RHOB|nr:HupE/UreJ family protein [Pseudohalocynthiibacter aestuariivivens]MBS9718838.1 HupE/UreJ family protein [Pseudohalocynthiibacter aestuariivivens]
MTRFCLLIAALAFLCGSVTQSRAHALEPGYLEISALSDTTWRVFWSRPDVDGRAMDIQAVLPADCAPRSGPAPTFSNAAWTSGWIAVCTSGMTSGPLTIEKLEQTRTDVLVRYEIFPGEMRTSRLTPDQTGFIIEGETGWKSVLVAYVPLGFEHILSGVDHLLFVFALLLLISDGWRLVGAITAFTVAHSLTLAAATLGLVTLPPAPVEAVIALSIVFLASELLLRGKGAPRLSELYPWAISFSFGLLHGFGFAGALSEIGLPQWDIPLALLSFNLGVEIGQLGFVALVFAVGWAAKRVSGYPLHAITTPQTPASAVVAYAIGGVSAYWLVDRVAGFF